MILSAYALVWLPFYDVVSYAPSLVYGLFLTTSLFTPDRWRIFECLVNSARRALLPCWLYKKLRTPVKDCQANLKSFFKEDFSKNLLTFIVSHEGAFIVKHKPNKV